MKNYPDFFNILLTNMLKRHEYYEKLKQIVLWLYLLLKVSEIIEEGRQLTKKKHFAESLKENNRLSQLKNHRKYYFYLGLIHKSTSQNTKNNSSVLVSSALNSCLVDNELDHQRNSDLPYEKDIIVRHERRLRSKVIRNKPLTTIKQDPFIKEKFIIHSKFRNHTDYNNNKKPDNNIYSIIQDIYLQNKVNNTIFKNSLGNIKFKQKSIISRPNKQ